MSVRNVVKGKFRASNVAHFIQRLHLNLYEVFSLSRSSLRNWLRISAFQKEGGIKKYYLFAIKIRYSSDLFSVQGGVT